MKLISSVPNKSIKKLTEQNGFSLIEVLLAIAILGGTILCLLGVLAPIMFKTNEITRIQDIYDIEGKINGFIQSRSFSEIFTYAKEGQHFYFYKDADGVQKITKTLNEIDGSSIIQIVLQASDDPDIAVYKAKDYPKSYLPICVGIYCLQNKENPKGMKAVMSSFITIKNR